MVQNNVVLCRHAFMRRERKITGGKQGLLSSGRKFAKAGFAAGFAVWPRRRTIIAVMAASVFLPIEVSDAGWLSDILKNSPKHGNRLPTLPRESQPPWQSVPLRQNPTPQSLPRWGRPS
jgi:hypothetical protein